MRALNLRLTWQPGGNNRGPQVQGSGWRAVRNVGRHSESAGLANGPSWTPEEVPCGGSCSPTPSAGA